MPLARNNPRNPFAAGSRFAACSCRLITPQSPHAEMIGKTKPRGVMNLASILNRGRIFCSSKCVISEPTKLY